ncbi:MAG: PIN domain-containing protein, partial [Spirochaetaceae bacterium]|nr:PIN domain-containing protein [Spirochaetaceae bacterium]
FIDTNIIVYAHDNNYPNKQVKAQEIIFNGMRGSNGVISVQVLSEFFVTVTKKNKQNYSIAAAKHEIMLLSYLHVIDIDSDLVIRAVGIKDLYQLSYWDSLILAAAERSKCSILYSEDLSHGQKYGGVHCINPFTDN